MSAVRIPVGVAPTLEIYSWWELVSGKLIELRRFQTVDGQAQVVVRDVNEDGELAQGEYVLTLRFLRAHGKPRMRATR